jgi:hypothetical protein
MINTFLTINRLVRAAAWVAPAVLLLMRDARRAKRDFKAGR